MGNDLCNAQLDQDQMYRNTTNSAYGAHYSQVRGYSVNNRGSSILNQKPVGLENLTNTCYISAILQNLFLILPDNMNKGKGRITQLFFKLKATKDTRDYKMFKFEVEKFIQIVRGFEQQDAQEFLINFLELLNNQNTQIYKKSPANLSYNQRIDVQQNYKIFLNQMKKIQSSVITNLFSAELLRCFTCEKSHTKNKFQRYQCLSLSFPTPNTGSSFLYSSSNAQITLRQLIQKELQGQPIQGLICQQCKQPRNFTKLTFLYTMPSFLILHLARFKKGYFNSEKINTTVQYDEQLSFQVRKDKSIAKYKLLGTVNHFGNLNRGHYFSEIRHTDGQWYEINDEVVRSSNLDPTRNKSKYVYILFYKRIK